MSHQVAKERHWSNDIVRAKVPKRCRGDNYFDAKKKCWTTSGEDADGKPLTRTFCQFIMDPVVKMCRLIIDGDKD